ncbi:class I SAM-dependent RNA methyltransferase [Sphingomonas sp. ASV193]|uniref:class I SAM-dependent RNA methyltransferase n=1 Tax=Sphingomonas sp. ASV193 TaxID=3144405 RepID=UPI0032E8CBC2
MSDPVVRIAARGDGVTSSGRHVAFGVPGDVIGDDGELVEGPDHVVPPCRHFPACGGCQLQHVSDRAYATYCEERVRGALAQQGIETDTRPALLSPPRSRRRATLRAVRAGGRILLGFNERGSATLVDLAECPVLRPELFALLSPLRALLAAMKGKAGEVQLTLADQGVDLLLRGFAAEGLAAVEALTAFGERHRLARIALDEGYGAEVRYEPRPATATLSGKAVPLPVGAFLQATEEGEAALVAAVREAVGTAPRTADLFAGIGTFAFALGGKVAAAEASRDAVLALKRAAPGLAVEHRDLYRRPLDASELGAYDAVVLDPPRAGAEAQVRELAGSGVPRIAYVSCNPATFARDAAKLVAGGYRLAWVVPVGQFRWSTHVELAAAFAR